LIINNYYTNEDEMQSRINHAVDSIKAIRDELNMYLGEQPSQFSPTIGNYIYQNARLNQLQAIVGVYGEKTNLSLRDIIYNHALSLPNLALIIQGLQNILRSTMLSLTDDDLAMAVGKASHELTQVYFDLKQTYNDSNSEDAKVDRILYQAGSSAKQVRKFLDIFLVNERLQLAKNPGTTIHPEMIKQLARLESVVGKPSDDEDRILSLWDLVSEHKNEFLTADNVSALIEDLDDVLDIDKKRNHPALRATVNSAIERLKQTQIALDALDSSENSDDEEYDSEEETDNKLDNDKSQDAQDSKPVSYFSSTLTTFHAQNVLAQRPGYTLPQANNDKGSSHKKTGGL
jgi:hypothetical protein